MLFKNKSRVKVVKKYRTYNRAKHFFKEYLEKSKKEVLYPKGTVMGYPADFELVLVGDPKYKKSPVYKKDELGRNVEVDLNLEGQTILKIAPIEVEEKIYDVGRHKRLTMREFIDQRLSEPGIKMVSKVRNRIIYQNNDVIELYSAKSRPDAERFIDILSGILVKEKRMDLLLVKDPSVWQRSLMYDLLVEKGYGRRYLYREFTTYPSKK